jgi:hypothetical protein
MNLNICERSSSHQKMAFRASKASPPFAGYRLVAHERPILCRLVMPWLIPSTAADSISVFRDIRDPAAPTAPRSLGKYKEEE